MTATARGLASLAALFAVATGWLTVGHSHHSVTGQFDPDQRVELHGVVTKVDWINPHTYLHLAVTNEDGTITNWRLESAPTAMLRKARITPDMLMDGGSPVTIEAIMARDGTANLAWLYRIEFSDGRMYRLSADR
jgi:hypothetical protein